MPIPTTAEQIVADLTERIYAGEYPAGTRLPTYREIGELYSVSFGTVGKVFWILRERGLVVGVRGIGVYVVEKLPRRPR